MKKYGLALDLRKDAEVIASYDEWHRKVWPEVKQSLWDAGVLDMEIYRLEDRLFMLIETKDDFSFERKAAMDDANPDVQRWEEMMRKLQTPIPGSKPGEWWRRMELVFKLQD